MAQSALISSAALEMYHNAFLVIDDCQDYSEKRRGKETMHRMLDLPRAINIGNATNVLALGFLLENLKSIGVSKALYIMHEIEQMARKSVEGQAMELDWIANNTFNLKDTDYIMMCKFKTCYYTIAEPCRIGYIIGNKLWNEMEVNKSLHILTEFGMSLGIAFQIQDDLLNLTGEIEKYGKEIGGDIFEGKRTIMLNHVISNSGIHSKLIKDILRKPRSEKTEKDVEFILNEMKRCGSIEHGKKLAQKYAHKAQVLLDEMTFLRSSSIQPEEQWECEFADRRFIAELVNYVVYRNL